MAVNPPQNIEKNSLGVCFCFVLFLPMKTIRLEALNPSEVQSAGAPVVFNQIFSPFPPKGAVEDPTVHRISGQSTHSAEGEKPGIKQKGFCLGSAVWLLWLMT